MTVNFTKGKFNLREKLKELERPSVDKLVTKDENGAYIDTIRGTTKLESIDSVISDTAVDIFIYDTSKDSDGGAWRHRTTHTSWYNEELNTTTRGSRKEFPAVAVIVLTGDTSTSQATIYDGDNPDLPMWMVIPDQSIDWASNGGAPTSIAALNGILSFTCKGSGILRLNFVKDFRDIFYGANYSFNNPTIVNRSDSSYSAGSSNGVIVNNQTNDVAMTVLPNATIDSATGLPVPTIAVATDGGVSVIKDDGTVVDITSNVNSNYDRSDFISISSDGFLVFPQHGTNEYSLMTIPIPSSDRTTVTSSGNATDKYIFNDQNPANTSLPKGLGVYQNGALRIPGTQFLNYPDGLVILDENPASLSNAMVDYITSDYNTGWMHGDIKGAFLSDTDATNVIGETIDLTNGSPQVGDEGNFSSITANQLVAGTTSDTIGRYNTGTTLETGKQYYATLTISNYSGSGDLGVASGGGFDSTFRYSANGTYTRYITGSDAPEIQIFYRSTNTATIGLSIREVDPDRSVNNKGLAVYGTVTKSAVATGAELVAYSGWSSSNYLRQPYNSDLDFGTGDFSITGWVKISSSTQSHFNWVLERQGGKIEVFTESNNNKLRIYLSGAGITSSVNIMTDTWRFFTFSKQSSICSWYIDGIFDVSTSISTNNNTTNNSPLTIGARNDGTWAFGGSISLIRISSSVPSPEQIKKMYEDEKVLFQENANATLYGSSDAVAALDYDEVTERLHVGTSGGRSEFQGLRRINNTTTAVTTAISAYDSFVVEQ